MKKIIHKIAGLALGLSLAVGVGVALSNHRDAAVTTAADAWTQITDLSQIANNDEILIENTDHYLPAAHFNAGGSGGSAFDIEDPSLSNPVWKVGVSGGNYTFSVVDGSNTYYLYVTNNNNGVSTTTTSKNWTITKNSSSSTFMLTSSDGSNTRYLTYASGNFRCYKTSGTTGDKYCKLYKLSSTPVPVDNHTITYDANGGTGTMADTIAAKPKVANCTFTAPEGKVFDRWNTDKNGNGTDYDVGQEVTTDVDLFAIWKDQPTCVTLDKIGTNAIANYTTDLSTLDITDGDNTYTINYVNGKKQNDAMILQKSSGAFISNKTVMPGNISSIELFINSGASGSATYDVAFSKTELTTATAGIGAVKITGGNSHEYVNSSVSGAKYFCITLGAAYNGQVLKIVINYESVDPSLKTMVIKESGTAAEDGSYAYKASGTYTFEAYEESTKVTGVTWSVSDSEVATINASTGALTTVKPGSVVVTAESEGYNNATASITITKGTLQSITVSGAMSKTAYTTNDTAWNSAGLVATGTYSTGWQETLSDVNWTFTPSVPAEGVTSVVAHATVGSVSNDSEAQAVSVTVAHAGTAQDPFTVAEALAKANEIGAVGNSGQGPWVTKGIITRVTSAPAATYWNATYYISDDGTQNNELQVYRGFYINNAKFDETTAQLLKAGKIVTVTGNLTGSYGCEYCANNYMLSLEDASTGDVDVTFEPELSIEVGATGTYTASSQIQGVTYEWSVDDADVLSVNSSTGAYEALSAGTARVTVTVTANNKTGETHADIVVNGNSSDIKSIAFANSCASGLDNNKTTPNYWYFKAYVTGFDADSQARAISVSDINETDSIILFIGKSGYSTFISGMELGRCLVFKAQVQNYGGTYELQNPELVSSNYSSLSFANEFLSGTDAVCDGYKDGDDNSTALGNIWDGFETSYNGLSEAEQAHLINTSGCGATIVGAMARYDHLIKAYPSLEAFVTNRVSNGVNGGYRIANSLDSNSSTIIIAVVALTSITSIGVLLVIKRKRSLVK